MLALPDVGALVVGKYRIEALLGQGGMGAVYRARHELIGTEVAIKWLHPNVREQEGNQERFLREARAAACVRHPHVVTVHDVGEHEGAAFLVMELLRGMTLDALLRRGPLPVTTLLRLLIEAMRGAEAAHACGLVHRDIKPENIFIVDDEQSALARGNARLDPLHGRAKLVDFGTSKWVDGEHRLTRSGAAVGTLEFMSYEQMHGIRDIDARTDLYAFGVVLYFALTGVSPFAGESIAEVALKVVTHTPPPLVSLRPDLPAALSAVVMKAIARRREQRYPSMSALIEALAPFARDGSLAALQTTPPREGPRLSDDESALRTRRLTLPAPLTPLAELPPAELSSAEQRREDFTPASGEQLRREAAPSAPAAARTQRTRRVGGRVALIGLAVGVAGGAAWYTRAAMREPSAALPTSTGAALPTSTGAQGARTTAVQTDPPAQREPEPPATLGSLEQSATTAPSAGAPDGGSDPRATRHDATPREQTRGARSRRRSADIATAAPAPQTARAPSAEPLPARSRVAPAPSHVEAAAAEAAKRATSTRGATPSAQQAEPPAEPKRAVAEGQRSGLMRRDDF